MTPRWRDALTDPEDSPLGAARHGVGRGRVREEAAVTRAAVVVVHRQLKHTGDGLHGSARVGAELIDVELIIDFIEPKQI